MNDFTDGITVEVMARRLTPREAAHVKYMTYMLRCATDEESLRLAERVTDPGHRWFCYCLDAIARREN